MITARQFESFGRGAKTPSMTSMSFNQKLTIFIAYIEESGAGKEGITNYLHMLGSGHIAYYMKTHGNFT